MILVHRELSLGIYVDKTGFVNVKFALSWLNQAEKKWICKVSEYILPTVYAYIISINIHLIIL